MMVNLPPLVNTVTLYLHTPNPTIRTLFTLLDRLLQPNLLRLGLGCILVLGKVQECTRIKLIYSRPRLLVHPQ